MKTPLLPALLSLFFAHGAPASAPAGGALALAENAPALITEPAPPVPEPETAAELVPALPAGMRVQFGKPARGKLPITVVHASHLVYLEQGGVRVLGYGSATLTASMAQPIVWETSEKDSLQTLVGDVVLEETSASKPKATLVPRRMLKPAAETAEPRHACKAFAHEATTFSVLCRVNSLTVSAARAFGDKPQDGVVHTASGETTFFRMALDPGEEGVDAQILGYADGVRGHVVRAEASFVAGEQAPSITLLSSSRAQPVPMPRFIHRHPPHIDRFFGFD